MTACSSCAMIIGLSDGPVAQLDRVSDSDSEGRAFESRRVRQEKHLPKSRCFFVVIPSIILRLWLEAKCCDQAKENSSRNSSCGSAEPAGKGTDPPLFLHCLYRTLRKCVSKSC